MLPHGRRLLPPLRRRLQGLATAAARTPPASSSCYSSSYSTTAAVTCAGGSGLQRQRRRRPRPIITSSSTTATTFGRAAAAAPFSSSSSSSSSAEGSSSSSNRAQELFYAQLGFKVREHNLCVCRWRRRKGIDRYTGAGWLAAPRGEGKGQEPPLPHPPLPHPPHTKPPYLTTPNHPHTQTIVRDRLQAARDEICTALGPGGEGYVVLRGFLRDDEAAGEGGKGRLCRNMREEAMALFKCVGVG